MIVESIRGLRVRQGESRGRHHPSISSTGSSRRAIESRGRTRTSDLGNPDADRLSIVSFLVRAPAHLGEGRYLHHNFVVAVLNDLFGIQARGGCSCAGPYGHRLLGIDAETSARFEEQIAAGCEVIKPGWVRINFNYFLPEEEFEYLVEAVHLVADLGWRLRPSTGSTRLGVAPSHTRRRHR